MNISEKRIQYREYMENSINILIKNNIKRIVHLLISSNIDISYIMNFRIKIFDDIVRHGLNIGEIENASMLYQKNIINKNLHHYDSKAFNIFIDIVFNSYIDIVENNKLQFAHNYDYDIINEYETLFVNARDKFITYNYFNITVLKCELLKEYYDTKSHTILYENCNNILTYSILNKINIDILIDMLLSLNDEVNEHYRFSAVNVESKLKYVNNVLYFLNDYLFINKGIIVNDYSITAKEKISKLFFNMYIEMYRNRGIIDINISNDFIMKPLLQGILKGDIGTAGIDGQIEDLYGMILPENLSSFKKEYKKMILRGIVK